MCFASIAYPYDVMQILQTTTGPWRGSRTAGSFAGLALFKTCDCDGLENVARFARL